MKTIDSLNEDYKNRSMLMTVDYRPTDRRSSRRGYGRREKKNACRVRRRRARKLAPHSDVGHIGMRSTDPAPRVLRQRILPLTLIRPGRGVKPTNFTYYYYYHRTHKSVLYIIIIIMANTTCAGH